MILTLLTIVVPDAFVQCGAVREIKLTQLPNSLVATVEFMERVRRQA